MLRKELLSKSKELLKEIQLPFKVRKDKKQLEHWIASREEEIAKSEESIEVLKSQEEFKIDAILDAQDDLDLAKRRLSKGQELLTEMFD